MFQLDGSAWSGLNEDMASQAYVSVRIDRERIRRNAQEIQRRSAVALYAVIKADAYGLGAGLVAEAIGDLVDGWCVFSLAEAIEAQLWQRTRKPVIALGPPLSLEPEEYLVHHVRPAVSNAEEARLLRQADPVLCVDTGMQRFACGAEQIDEVIEAGQIREAFTHATRMEHVQRLVELTQGRGLKLHAAASSLLDRPEARLDAVRPGLALYRGAVRVSAPLVEVHQSRGPVGYTGFSAQRHGVILAGYARGLHAGPCLVNGQCRQIPEVGMQSAYVELGPEERVGDEVVLLGDDLLPDHLAPAWASTPHEVLLRLSKAGRRTYL